MSAISHAWNFNSTSELMTVVQISRRGEPRWFTQQVESRYLLLSLAGHSPVGVAEAGVACEPALVRGSGIARGSTLPMTSNGFENSRVSKGTLRTERPAGVTTMEELFFCEI